MTTVLWMMTLQGLMGAFDTLWHHEITERLPSKPSARDELAIHALREFLYAIVFLGIGWFAWLGLWAWVLAGIFLVEIAITLWDFVIEDQTRKLPKLERITHTVLAINYGAILMLFAPELWAWAGEPSALAFRDYGLLSWIMTAFGAGVFAWSIRDLIAAIRLGPLTRPLWQRQPYRVRQKSAPKTFLVTGATGFIGRDLCRRLIERGDRVIVLTRERGKAGYLFGPHARAVESLEEIASAERIDGLVNLAGEPLMGGLWTRRRKLRFLESRLHTTEAVLALIRRLEEKPAVLVTASAIGFYGIRGDEALDEAAAPQAIFMSELCQRWEELARQGEELGLRVCRLRIGLVLGLDGGAFPPMALPLRLGLGAVFGSGRQWVSWIWMEDLLRLLLFALADPRAEGAVNATAPEPVTHAAFMAALARAYRRPLFMKVPGFFMRTALGEMADLLLTGQRVLPRKARGLGFVFAAPDLAAALEQLVPSRAAGGLAGDFTVYFNDRCPVCSREIAHYRRKAASCPDSNGLRFRPLSECPDALASYGIAPEAARKRLYALDREGRLHGGLETFQVLWARVPGLAWLARLVSLPLVRPLAGLLYDRAAVPILWRWNRRRERMAAARPAPEKNHHASA